MQRNDPYSYLKDLKNSKTREFIQGQNSKYEHFFATKGRKASKIKREINRRQGRSESLPKWKDEDGISYEWVFPQDAEYEVLNRNEVAVVDFNKLAKKMGDLSIGDVECYRNSAVMGLNTTGEPHFSAKIFDFVSLRFYKESIPCTDAYAWTADGSAFFYSVVDPEKTWTYKVMLHRVGCKVGSDELIYEEKDPKFAVGMVRGHSKLFVGSVKYPETSEWRVYDLHSPLSPPVLIKARTEGLEYFPGEVRNGVVLKTNLDGCTNYQLKYCPWKDVGTGDTSLWKSLVPHSESAAIVEFCCFEKYVVCELVRTCNPHLLVVDLADPRKSYEIELNTGGEPYEAAIAQEQNAMYYTPKFRFSFSTMTRPLQTMECHLEERVVSVVHEQLVNGLKLEKYESERIYAPSRDKKSHIPVSILRKRGGKTKYVYLEGYNAYGFGHEVGFRRSVFSLADRKCAYAVCHGRGSMAYGRSWYDDGRKLNKMNSFYDLIDCATYFKSMGYKVVVSGASAGGLLVMASTILAPSVFSGCVAEVPFVQVVDSLTNPNVPLTEQEYEEWGNPENEEVLKYLQKYSPYDNVDPDVVYPPILLSGSLSDAQCQYYEPLMMARKLKKANRHNSVLCKIYTESFGHQGNTKRLEGIGELAETFAFAMYCFKK